MYSWRENLFRFVVNFNNKKHQGAKGGNVNDDNDKGHDSCYEVFVRFVCSVNRCYYCITYTKNVVLKPYNKYVDRNIIMSRASHHILSLFILGFTLNNTT